MIRKSGSYHNLETSNISSNTIEDVKIIFFKIGGVSPQF